MVSNLGEIKPGKSLTYSINNSANTFWSISIWEPTRRIIKTELVKFDC